MGTPQTNAGAGSGVTSFGNITGGGLPFTGGGGMDFTGGGGGMSGGGFDTAPADVVGDPLTDPFWGAQALSTGATPLGGTGGAQTVAPPDVGGAQSADQSGQQQQQQQQPSAAGGAPVRQPQPQPTSDLGKIIQSVTQPQGPSWIQPQGGQAPGGQKQQGGLGGIASAIGKLLSGSAQAAPAPTSLSSLVGGAQTPGQTPAAPTLETPQGAQAPVAVTGGTPRSAGTTPPSPQPVAGTPGAEPGAAPAQAAPGAAPGTPEGAPGEHEPAGLPELQYGQPGAEAPPAPSAAPEAGGAAPAPAPAPAQTPAEATARGQDPIQSLLQQLSGGRAATTPRAPAQGGVLENANEFITSRGGHSTRGSSLTQGAYGAYRPNQRMGEALRAAGQEFERTHPGQRAQFGEGDRDPQTQAVYYNRYRTGRGGIAARPGHSEHQRANAMDIPDGPFADWLKAGNARRFNLHNPVRGDENHFQLMGGSGPRSAAPAGTQVAQAGEPTAMGGQPLPGSRGVAQAPAGGFKWTAYAPGGGMTRKQRRMEGGPGTSGPNLEGQRVPRTLDDYRAGRSRYVSVAGPPSMQGQTVMIPTPEGPVPGYIHDTGDRFPEGTNKLDVAAFRGRRGVRPDFSRYRFGPQSSAQPSTRVAMDRGTGPPDIGTAAGTLPQPEWMRTIERLNQQRKRDQGIDQPARQQQGGEQAPFQVAGDVVPMPRPPTQTPMQRWQTQDPGARGAQSIDQFGGRQGPNLDLMDILQFPGGGPAGRRGDLLNWILQNIA